LRACGALTPEEGRRLAETLAAFGEEERRAPILTGNWRHFERVPGLEVIRARRES
jgi:hypothetical protein